MFTTTSKITRPGISKTPTAFPPSLGAWCDSIAGHFIRRAAITSLRDLDDRALRDIGLVRSQINAAVHGRIARSAWERTP